LISKAGFAVELTARVGAKELWDEQMFEFGASHKQNWTSIKRFGRVRFTVPQMPKTLPDPPGAKSAPVV